ETDHKGRFSFVPNSEHGTLAIVHESGYAVRDANAMETNIEIKLIPWARVKGQLEGSGEQVYGKRVYLRADPSDATVEWGQNTSADREGRFKFDFVPSIRQSVSGALSRSICPQPGETLIIDVNDFSVH
ncbi:MAG: hypothetical protein JXN61_07245, partial [Sedimentisphaerales bacterium]|nr:hypothetical protein [Sedimentisphaerales bacterium]